MDWNLAEAIAYYRKQGAPRDQSALLNLLREVQRETGGGIPQWALTEMARSYDVKESLFLALIRRIPGLRLENTHLLEICAGPNCSRKADLLTFAQARAKKTVTVKAVPCQRQCGKGPNLRFDGRLYSGADEALVLRLLKEE